MKNTYRESENGGLAWLADRGAREAKFDGQGSLVSLPEKETSADKYDRLLKVFFEFGCMGHEHMTPDRFFKEHGFDDLAEAVYNGWKACRHKQNKVRADWCVAERDAAKSTAKREEGEGVRTSCHDCGTPDESYHAVGCATLFTTQKWIHAANPPSKDHTAQPPFTREEIAIVRGMRQTALEVTYEQMAQRCREGKLLRAFAWARSPERHDYWRSMQGAAGYTEEAKATALTDEARAKLLRYASIAQHLADMGE